ncbi:uncharacterized protein LOC144161525 [Haemaphysalis longicornis]
MLIAGDFNAHHPDWGHRQADARGSKLVETTEAARLMLTNDLEYPTRHGLHAGQQDTVLDLTWADQGTVWELRCGVDPMGSDHYPIWICVDSGAKNKRRRIARAVDWDAFREAVGKCERNLPITEKLRRAV